MNRERPPRSPRLFSRDVGSHPTDPGPDPADAAPDPADAAPDPADAAPDPADAAPDPADAASDPADAAPDPADAAPDADAAIHALAARQHGVVARRQLVAAGLGASAIDNRVRNGRLEVVHRGVYRARGPVRGRREREMAAVLACGDEALVSHRTAAGLWALLPRERATAPTHVTATGHYRHGASLVVHRVRAIEPAHRALLDGVPLTAPARTLLDLAGAVAPRELEQALAAAARRDLAADDELLALLAAHPRRRGVPVLRALLGSATAPAYTRSEAEERFLDLVRRARLPAPATNVVVLGMEVDFLWKRERVVVEVDGFTFHGSLAAFERDRRRDAALHAAGYIVLRFPWRDIRDEAEVVLKRLVEVLTPRATSRTTGPRTGRR